MDMEAVKVREAVETVKAANAAAIAQADRYLADLNAQLSEMAANGNRFQRRKVKIARRRIDAFEKWYRSKMEEINRGTFGLIDIDAGTLKAVQEEASARLAAIFN